MTSIENILQLYDSLSEDEKIKLFLQLQSKDMREHYDPTYKKYCIQVKNYYGEFLVNTILSRSYNLRGATRQANQFLFDRHMQPYDALIEDHMTYDDKVRYRNTHYLSIEE